MKAARTTEIEEVIASNDISKARKLISAALKNEPDADIYYLASMVALDDNQKKEFLNKALELDPFHEEANNDLSKKQVPSLPKDIKLAAKDGKLNTKNFQYFAEWFFKQSSLTKLYIIGAGSLIVFILPILWALINNQPSKTTTPIIPTKLTTYTPSETTVNSATDSQPTGSSENLSEPTSSPVPLSLTPLSNQSPIIDRVEIRDDRSSGKLVILQDIFFSDIDSDANYVHYQLISITPGATANTKDGSINMTSDQKNGSVITGRWNCGDGYYDLTLEVTIYDQAGHASNPVRYTMNCN